MIVIKHSDGKFYSRPGCITWFTDEMNKVKVYSSKDEKDFKHDLKTLERSKLYKDHFEVIEAPEEILATKPKIY